MTTCAHKRAADRVTIHNANGYSHGCRCEICKAAQNERMRSYFRERGGNPYRKVVPKVACAGGCGKQIRGGTCRDCTATTGRRLSQRRRDAQAKLRKAARGSRSRWAWVQGQCAECGDQFTRRCASGGAVPFCSTKCRQRSAKRDRRALEVGAKLTRRRRWIVFERDDWTCKLCGFPVQRDAVVPDLEAPVIDHVVALARGGAHGEENWQTAHFLCNSYKRDLDMAEVA